MCGVGALFSNRSLSNIELILNEINKTQVHRGPDGNGIWHSDNKQVGLAHTRLSIIDLTNASAQPIKSSDGRYVMSYNGEVYNYKELAEECRQLGSVFKTTGDAEVVLECYRHFGEKISQKLRGMWAFIIIDTLSDNVFISRDPFGIKPLFYGENNGVLIFASEIKAFHKIDTSFLEIDDITIELFEKYRSYDRGNWTFFKNIKKFPGGHHLSYNLNSIPSSMDLKPNFYLTKIGGKKNNMDETELAQNLKKEFEQSIRLHMRSDVPVGFCLSGGIDSSSILATARKLFPETELKTFTTKFGDHQRIDETEWAQMVIDHVNATPKFVSPDASRFVADLPHLIEVQDEPFGSASIYSQYCIFRDIHKSGIKVVLDGQGADEIFAGYHSFFPFYIYSLLEEGKYLEAIKVAYMLKRNHNYDFAVYLKLLTKVRKAASKIKRLFKKSPTTKKVTGLNIEKLFYTQKGSNDTLARRLSFINRTPTNFDEFLVFMIFEGNVPMLLRFEDRNSMAFSVESRVPFLINELVDFSLKIPSKFKMKNGITKYILRESMRRIVPDKVLDRMDKLGFPAPDKEWMKELYGKDVSQPFSDEWIQLMLAAWKEMLSKRQEQCLNTLGQEEKNGIDIITSRTSDCTSPTHR